MGRYSDSEDEYRKSKKKKKRTSRSRSRSSDSSYSSYSSKKHKKVKKKHKKRSRSRSGSRNRHYSPYRRSVSPRRRRSRSPRRRSRSRSRDRYRSRSPKYRRSRSRSRSWSRSKRRSRSRSRTPRGRRSRSRSRDRGVKSEKSDGIKDPSRSIPGWDLMGPAEQAEARLQLALKAAANVDENLREQGLLGGRKLGGSSSNSPLLTFDERINRNKAISDIESGGFSQAFFKSSKSQKSSGSGDINDAHDAAIFGGEIPMGAGGEMPILSFSNQPLKDKDTESLMHPNLYVSAEEKMDRWIAKLKAFRRQKLEGILLK